jgi:hypothetical protein
MIIGLCIKGSHIPSHLVVDERSTYHGSILPDKHRTPESPDGKIMAK